METTYDRAALFEYMDDAASVGDSLKHTRDEVVNHFKKCRQQYSRLHTELEQRIRKAQNAINYSESEIAFARAEYDAACNASNENDDSSQYAARRMHDALIRIHIAEDELTTATSEFGKAKSMMKSLTEVWEQHILTAESLHQAVEDNYSTFFSLMTKGNSDIGEYIGIMDKAHASLYDSTEETLPNNSITRDLPYSESSSHSKREIETIKQFRISEDKVTTEASTSPLGWCADNSMAAVHISQDGRKTVTLEIQGCVKTFDCTKTGVAKAYREAVKCGDQDLIARTSAMFELETIRESLDLGSGDPDIIQMGGYHRDVRIQDPPRYESHHIPARSVQSENAEWLPTISITESDHKKTSSYSGKQRHITEPIIPSNIKPMTHKRVVSEKIAEGGSGYVEAVRDELLELRACTGHKYDGGVSAFLDAVIDMLARRGIPDAR